MDKAGIVRAELDAIRRLWGNDRCADCGLKDPTWTAYNLGIWICESCANIHRDIGPQISRLKSIFSDDWDEDQLRMLAANGNEKCRLYFEQDVPPAYRRPRPIDLHVIKDQWIRGKYERLDFTSNCNNLYECEDKQGYLWKKGKAGPRFSQRRFVLRASDNSLSYFIHDQSKSPKATLPLDQLNVTLVPDKVPNPFSMQLMVPQSNNLPRSIFISANTGQELIQWYTAIRMAKLKSLFCESQKVNVSEITQLLSRDFVKEGWLLKTGPKPGDAYRKRWIVLDENVLYYYKDPLDAFPKAKVIIGSRQNGFTARENVPSGVKTMPFAFTLKTPKRNYCFSATSENEMNGWIDVLVKVTRRSSLCSDDPRNSTSCL